MPEIQEQPTASTPSPTVKTSSVMRRVLRYIRRTLLVLLLLVLALLASLQTGFVRGIIKSEIVSLVESNTNGTISIGEIGGNFFTGVSLGDVSLRLKNDTASIARIKFVSVRYSLFAFLSKNKIIVHSLLLDGPNIVFHRRVGDSLWNYEHLLKPSAPGAPPSPFSQTINLENLSMAHGTFRVVDENDSSATGTLPNSKKKYIRWSDLDLQDIALSLSGRYAGASQQYVKLDHLSLREANAPFNLYQLSFTAFRDSTVAEVKDLRLLSDHTDLTLDATMSPLGVLVGLPYDSLRASMTHLKLHASSVGEELAQFIPDVSFLGGRPSLDLEAEGPYGTLKITQGRIGFRRNSFVTFVGEVRNLHQPEKLFLDVVLNARSLSDRTVREYIPGLGLPDMTQFGTIDIPCLHFKGPPDNFATELDIRTTNGSVTGKAALDLRHDNPTYTAELATKNINLAPLVGDSSLRSDLTVLVKANGEGFDPKSMHSVVTIDGNEGSHIYGLDATSLHISGATDHGLISLDQSNAHFADGSHVEIQYANIDLSKPVATYAADVSATDAPIGKFVSAFPHSSTVNANVTIKGDLASLSSMRGSVSTVVSGLRYRNTSLQPIVVNVLMQRDSITGEQVNVVSSDIVDLTVRGTYNIATIGPVLADRFISFAHSIEHLRDSVQQFDTVTTAIGTDAGAVDSVHLSYALKMKDLRALDHFIPGLTILAKGTLDGHVDLEAAHLMSISMAGKLDHMLLTNGYDVDSNVGTPMLSVKDLDVDVALRGLAAHSTSVLNELRGNIRIGSDSALRISGLGFTSPHVSVDLASDLAKYDASGSIEGKTAFRIKGEGSIAGAEKSFGIDSVQITFSNGFDWYNESGSRLSIGSNGLLTLDTLRLFKPEPSYDPGNRFAQKMQVGFQLKGDTIRYAYVHSPQLRLPEIPRFISPWADISAFRPSQGKFNRLRFDMHGTMSHPEAAVDMAVENFALNDVTLDSAKANITYMNGILRGSILAHVDASAYVISSMARGLEKWTPLAKNDLRIDIDTLPLLFSLSDYPTRRADRAKLAALPMSVRVSAHDFPLDMFAPFIPFLTQIHGLADAAGTLTGSLSAPVITANATVTKGSFLIPTTNIRYQTGGVIRFEHSDLIFDDVRVQNFPADLENGSAILNGGFHFRGFEVDTFGLVLRANNRFLVLSDASKNTLRTIYGPLIVRSGSTPISFHGTFDQPHLDGDLTIVQAYLSLPQNNASATEIESNGIVYLDASLPPIPTDSVGPNLGQRDSLELAMRDAEMREFEHLSHPPSATETGTHSAVAIDESRYQAPPTPFIDKMLYDLNVDILGDCWLIITFPQAYGIFGSQLKAELRSDGNLHLTRFQQRANYNMSGTLAVTGRSSYSFIKEFTPVEGTMKFFEALDNPTLNLSAEYNGSYAPGDVRIRMLITGTRYDPILTFELWQKNQQGDYARKTESQDQQRNESFFFLATGMLPNDAGAGTAAATLSSLGDRSLYSTASSVGSSVANSILASTSLKDYIRSVGIELGGAGGTNRYNATLGIKGISDVVIHGGYATVGNAGSSTDITLEVPFSKFFSFKGAQNILLQPEYHNSTLIQSLVPPPEFVARIAWRIPLD